MAEGTVLVFHEGKPVRVPAWMGFGGVYGLIETNEPVKSEGDGLVAVFRSWDLFPRRRANAYARDNKPLVPSYRLVVERVGAGHYIVRAFQNKLIEVQPGPDEVRNTVERLMD